MSLIFAQRGKKNIALWELTENRVSFQHFFLTSVFQLLSSPLPPPQGPWWRRALPTGPFQKVLGGRRHLRLASAPPAPRPCQDGASFLHVTEGKVSIMLREASKMSFGAPEVGMGAQGDAAGGGSRSEAESAAELPSAGSV